ncbi:Uncharacterized protein dnm_021790 [Desulfonema magnum]|uniref:Uncharacterized protein n=1 Tax=Desulfonema magnum TaxID=45655 RepID=A0A975GMT7_9BACT|nr:Uncharacterized protein dnm_021790 [Desulfonema magnum]
MPSPRDPETRGMPLLQICRPHGTWEHGGGAGVKNARIVRALIKE